MYKGKELLDFFIILSHVVPTFLGALAFVKRLLLEICKNVMIVLNQERIVSICESS